LAIAPVFAESIRVSYKHRVIDSTLSVDSADFDGGGFRSRGDHPLSFWCASWGGGGVADDDGIDDGDARKCQRRCLPQTTDDGGCRQRFSGGDDDNKEDACPSR
jgi:hypothetical protein